MAKLQLDAVLKLVDVQINPKIYQQITQSVAGLPVAMQNTAKATQKVTKETVNLNKSVKKTGKQLNANEYAARLLLRRMAQFAILLPTFATLNKALQGSIKFLFDFDSALRDIVRIDITALKDDMEEIGDAALTTARNFGVSAVEVLNTTKVFKQAGFDIAESQDKANAAILATQISTLTSAQAIEVFIAASKQFGKEGENSAAVLDKLAKVEDIAAVNAADVAEAFRTGGNALAFFTKSIDNSIGLIAALREQTRKSGREIGTFFKTFATRLTAAGDAQRSVEALGIQIKNLDGSIRPGLEILNDLGAAFDGLTEAQKATQAKAIAGVRQFESLLGVLNSLGKANDFARESTNAAGTANEKKLITDQKLDRVLGRLISQGQSLSETLGDAGLEDSLKGVLDTGTKLLSIIEGIVERFDDIDVTPLLALAGAQGIKAVFGLSSKKEPMSPMERRQRGAEGPGIRGRMRSLLTGGLMGRSRMGDINAKFAQKAFAAANKGVKDFTKGLAANTKSLLFSSTMTKQNGLQFSKTSLNIAQNAKAFAKNTAMIFANTRKRLGTKEGGSMGAALGVMATLAATKIGPAADKFAEGLEKDGKIASAALADAGGSGLTAALSFATLGTKVAGTIGLMVTAGKLMLDLVDAYRDRGKANEMLEEQAQSKSRIEQLALDFSDPLSEAARGAGDVLAKEIGKSDFAGLAKATGKAFEEIADGLSAIDGVAPTVDELRQAFFSTKEVVAALVQAQGSSLDRTAEANGTEEELANLRAILADETKTVGDANASYFRVLVDGGAAISEATGRIKRALDFKEFKDAQKVIDFTSSIRQLGLELEIAKLGPEAMADSLVALQQEVILGEEAFAAATRSQKDRRDALIRDINEDLGGTAFANIVQVFDAIGQVSTEELERYEELIRQIPETQRARAEELLQILKEQVNSELELQRKKNAVTKEENTRSKALLEAETQASQNAFASAQKLNAELAKFGQGVNLDTLSAFENISLSDIDDVLAGTSGLEAGVQELIKSAFGGEIKKAQSQLGSVAAKTEAELNTLSGELEIVEAKLADQANASNFASLTAEKHAITLAMEEAKQNGAIALTQAKIKVLEAEQEAAEEAAEAEAERLKLLEELADASREFEKELLSVRRQFEEFNAEKIADFTEREADAREELQDAQGEVIESTKKLADDYKGLLEAQLEYNNALAEAQLKANLLSRDIGALTGSIVTFDDQLAALGNAFDDALSTANISLEKRISLEQQLAEETLSFLQKARDEIVQAGTGIFGQTGTENRELGQGIAGLQFVADQLGGSFENFLNLSQGQLGDVTTTLLGLPAEFRQQILGALSFLPSSTDIGGFSVEQLRQAIGQVGAGVDPDAGLPSIEELNNQQVEQLSKLQELALQDAQLQFEQVVEAQKQVELAEQAVDAAKIAEERAKENLGQVRDAILDEKAVLDQANVERRELLSAVIAADDKNTLMQIEKEAQLFAEQNATFRDIGDQIVSGIGNLIGARLSVLEATQAVTGAFRGHIPNFAGGNLTPNEAASLLRAGAREKRAMPAGAGLAVANTSEAIIPMRAGGFIPNYQDGSQISAGISAIKGINETVVAAIARSVTSALADLRSGESDTPELLEEIVGQLNTLNSTSDDISATNATVAANSTTTDSGAPTTSAATQRVEISLQTNQNNTVSITGLENLRSEIEDAISNTTADQVDVQVSSLLEQLDEIVTALQERGILSAFGQTR